MILDLIQGTDKSKGDDPDAAGQLNESICGPSYKNDWIDSLTVYLSFEEASFLSGKIGANVPLSLLGQLLLDADVVLHELAHILDRAVLCDERRDEPVEKIQFESLVVANATRQSPRTELPPYAGHGSSFLRLVVHLAHRTNLAGFDTSPAAIFAGHRHQLSPASSYQDALDDEPSQQINNRLRDLPSVELPSRFLEVWNSDVRNYERHTSSANGVSQ